MTPHAPAARPNINPNSMRSFNWGNNKGETMAEATGIGGVFLKARDPKALSAWYATHMGITPADDKSLIFDGPPSMGMTVFAHFPADTAYFRRRATTVDGQFPSGRSR